MRRPGATVRAAFLAACNATLALVPHRPVRAARAAQVRSGGVDVLVVDSVAALVPRAELEGEMGDHHIALQARLMSQVCVGGPSSSGPWVRRFQF